MADLDIYNILSSGLYGLLGLGLFIFSVWLLETITSYSIKKEILEDQNTAMGIVIGCMLIAVAIIVASAIR